MDINSITASKIKTIRNEARIKAEAVAISLGITKATYSKLENGKLEITLERLQKIANILNVPFNSLVGTSSPLQINKDSSHSNINSQINYGDSSIKELLLIVLKKLDTQ